MRNNNYLGLINFKVKLYGQKLFINELDVGGSNVFTTFKTKKKLISYVVFIYKKKFLTIKFYFEIN